MSISNDTYLIASVIIVLLILALNIMFIRWVLRVNDIVFYLDKINEKMGRIETELKKQNDKVAS
jgi:hypothetical protein